MRIQILFFLLALSEVLALTSRSAHSLTAATTSHASLAGQMFLNFQMIGVIVVLVAVGACCWYFRGCFGSQERAQETTVIVQPQSQRRQENRVAAPPARILEPVE